MMFTPEWITAILAILITAAAIMGGLLRLERRLTRIETLLNSLPCQEHRKKLQEDRDVVCPGVQVLD